MMKAITNCTIYSGEGIEKDKVILVDKGEIVDIRKHIPGGCKVANLHGSSIAPGLIDLQMNGGEQRYFSQFPDANTLSDMSNACIKYGTSYFLPTLISSPPEKIITAIDDVRDFMQQHPESGVLGMHLEGPFISPEKRGTHNIHTVRKATDEEIANIIAHGKGIVKLMTVGPEMFTEEQLRRLQKAGITLSVGHSNLTYEEAQHYFDEGIHLVTHLFNAMSDFSHRAPGIVGAALDNGDVYTPMILDGHHSHFAAGRIASKIKRDKFLLTTDCAFLGRQVKSFSWEDFTAVLKDGCYVNNEGHLSGSAISMRDAVANAVTHIGASVREAIEMATSRVARALQMEKKIGFIKPGYPARFFVFDEGNISDGKCLHLQDD